METKKKKRKRIAGYCQESQETINPSSNPLAGYWKMTSTTTLKIKFNHVSRHE